MVLSSIAGGNARNYLLGRGKVLITDAKRYSGASLVDPSIKAWRDIGNVTDFTISQESELKEHKSSLLGIQTIDLQVPVSQKMTISMTVDEINAQNLARFFSGELLSTDIGYAGIANAAAIASDNVAIGAAYRNFYVQSTATDQVTDVWFNLEIFMDLYGVTARAIDFESGQTFIVRKNPSSRTATGTGTLLAENTDFTLDRKMGRIKFNPGVLAPGDSFLVNWTTSSGTNGKNNVTAIDTQLWIASVLTNSGVSVALQFTMENPNDRDQPVTFEAYKVKLKPDGDFKGIGDDWGTITLTGVLESVTNPPVGGSLYGRWLGRNFYAPDVS